MAIFQIKTVKDLGLAVKDRRKVIGRTQAELATEIGVSRQWLSEVESGKTRAEIGLILRLLKRLDI